VQVAYHGGQMVLWRNWLEIAQKYDLQYNNMVEFKIRAFVLKTTIYKSNSSTAMQYTYPNHALATTCLFIYVCL
jgi:hypothetical protein